MHPLRSKTQIRDVEILGREAVTIPKLVRIHLALVSRIAILHRRRHCSQRQFQYVSSICIGTHNNFHSHPQRCQLMMRHSVVFALRTSMQQRKSRPLRLGPTSCWSTRTNPASPLWLHDTMLPPNSHSTHLPTEYGSTLAIQRSIAASNRLLHTQPQNPLPIRYITRTSVTPPFAKNWKQKENVR